MNKISINDETIINFLNICNDNIYYKCELFQKPNERDYFSFNNKESCPAKNYESTSFLLSVSYLLIDLICFVFLFFIEYLILKKIKFLIENPQEVNNQNREVQATINSTINNNQQNSNINNENNNNNNNNNSVFKKEATQTLIIESVPQNEEIYLCPKNKENENITRVNQNEDKKIINLKRNSHNLKLLNINYINNENNKKPEAK